MFSFGVPMLPFLATWSVYLLWSWPTKEIWEMLGEVQRWLLFLYLMILVVVEKGEKETPPATDKL